MRFALRVFSPGIVQVTSRKTGWLAQRQTTVEIGLREFELQKKPNSDPAVPVIAVFHANDRGEEAFVGRRLVAKRECNDEPHPHEIMGHTGAEIEAVAGKVAYFPYVDNVDKSGVEWLNLHGQGHFEAFPPPAMAGAMPRNIRGVVNLDSGCHLVASWCSVLIKSTESNGDRL
jgi:hypothetical protein